MIIVDGKALAQKILSKIKTGLDGRSVSIAAVWAGDNLAIGRFVEMKKKAANSVGINMDIYHLASEDAIASKLKELADDKSVTGIIVELPLPPGYNRDNILKLISQDKDIDVLNGSPLLPPAVSALKTLFEEYKIEPKGKTAAVFGQSILVGGPISNWLENMGAKVFRIDENTENTRELCLKADIIVSGVGKPNLITGNMIKDGAVVVDFGFEKLGDKVAGDVDFNSVAPKSSLITPVPGGMGPIVIASFLENALTLYLSSAQ
ncbi:MAG: bifunctional 5,10-methylenetetrahydrofolate dehydrogenase/5,10-methenyltetrahydrofolate cyclohydrolase [Candidatus Yanofskybacteria bacterium]|nr:bifunctional 5,10-methylenetetrahydrofolate dehydrogenase/5,10-methenyltetrahydrofolate cyclohydrolase [Candidatus Yanofskybacteria bacterium]